MPTQSELKLEDSLIAQLEGMRYEVVWIDDEAALLANLKSQIEKHNDVSLSAREFDLVLNHLNKGNVFDRAKILRDRMFLLRDDGSKGFIEFINQRAWCENRFQVTRQVSMEGSYKNRYDVTILINGLPLVQVELKRRGLELKEAFNQTMRYQRHSFWAGMGLFQYIQLFVISNGVNTKYYANNRKQSFKFTSFWTDRENVKITDLDKFTQAFLEPCHLAKMICKYTVLAEATKSLMILRPYQYYAVEAIVDRVGNSTKNGYIWHTTGSGKTLTSFKASQILVDNPDIYKVVFVVDRNDLDTQTIKEFNSFKEGSVDTTHSTKKLVAQFGDPSSPLIVTTIQKLGTAITKDKHAAQMSGVRDKRIVFIFDECHRSQFGEVHQRICDFFTNRQLFGFTGTPIFAENASGNGLGKRTTKELFDECLHKYVITDAIGDENVLKFAVEYVGRYQYKDSANNVDIEVEGIDTRELMESPERLEKIVDYVIANHDRKTHARDFTAMMCISSVDVLTRYYELFRARREAGAHNLKVATIFSYTANEEDKDANGLLDGEIDLDQAGPVNMHSRDKLESYIGDYNQLFGTAFTTRDSQSFYNYYRDIATRVKRQEIDLLLVVNMFLTGFDSKTLNTLYVDKNLRYHGLLQAYSRTNRILDERKSQGNIVVFRNLKKATDDALELFANKEANETIFMHPYEVYVAEFERKLEALRALTPTPGDVDILTNEEQELAFVTAFRELLRVKNILSSFADFKFADTGMTEQTFEDFKSKYLDIYDKVRGEHDKELVSILDDVDFELELIRRDDVNVSYIMRLLARLVEAKDGDKEKIISGIMGALSSDAVLRSKRELIEKFIKQSLPEVKDPDQVEDKFNEFWDAEKVAAFTAMCREEGLLNDRLQKLIDDYLYSGQQPRREDFVAALAIKPKILEREPIIGRIKKRFNKFIETFVEGI
jgi:type I restriction enzyme R subunit